ncbi:MAG TPA: endonuclease/exonuclease/phosphatase family protein, partial [Terriglobales bacterium]|nr:endonuclease/exonuclease/phosphatase family protein [Terriglobales bacterium]
VASFNMLNFASNTNRINKASLAIRNVMRLPDVIGVEEVNTLATLQALASKINSDAQANNRGTPNYAAELLAPSGDQNVGFLFRKDRVTDVSVVQVGDEALMPNSDGTKLVAVNDRPPLVMTAKLLPPVGQPFPVTIIVNHLRSLIDVDTVGGDFARRKRQLGAEYLANLIAQHQSAGEHVISVGDYNAYEFNDGLVDVLGTIKGTPTAPGEVLLASDDLIDPNLVDMATTVAPEQRYSYVENGNAQTLDHIVVTGDLLARPYHLEIAHNNSEFPGDLYSNANRSERVSDHDMPVAYFSFPPPAADLSLTMSGSTTVLSGAVQQYTLQLHNAGPDAADEVTLVDSLPAHTTFHSITSPAGWTCSTPAVGASGSVSCTAASVASGADAQFTLELLADCATANGVQILNAAGVTSKTSDPDGGDNSATQQTSVSNPPPQITALTVDTPMLWSPNHKMVPVALSYTVTDNCNTSLIPAIAIKSNQAVTAAGPHAADWEVVDATHVLLRAERMPPGDRVYTISLTATDSAGNPAVASVNVVVPQSQSN